MTTYFASDYIRDFERRDRAKSFVSTLLARGLTDAPDEAVALAEVLGVSRKDASPMFVGDGPTDIDPRAASFLAEIDERDSILGALRRAGALDLTPEAAMIAAQLGTIAPETTAEGAVKPVMRLHFDLRSGTPSKVAPVTVVSAELARLPNAQATITAALTQSARLATDVAALDVLTAGSPVSPAGTTVLDHIGTALRAVSRASKPCIIADVASLALVAGELAGLREICTIVPSPAADGRVIAVDAAGVAIADERIDVTVARHASVQVGDGGSPEAFSTVSLFQANLIAIRTERYFRLAVRDSAVAWCGGPA